MYVLRLLWNGTALGTAKLFLHQVVEYFLYYLALMKSDLTGRNQNSRKNGMRNFNPKMASVLPFNEPKRTRTFSRRDGPVKFKIFMYERMTSEFENQFLNRCILAITY